MNSELPTISKYPSLNSGRIGVEFRNKRKNILRYDEDKR